MRTYNGEPTQANRICWVPNCERNCYAREMCRYHWTLDSQDRLIDVLFPQVCWCGEPVKKNKIVCKTHDYCSIDDCEEPAESKGLCKKHHMDKWLENPENRAKANAHSRNYKRPKNLGPVVPKKEVPGYFQSHKRVKAAKGGSAQDFECIDCGEQAYHWSLNNDAPVVYIQYLPNRDIAVYYSIDPDMYDPRCTKCHKEYDMNSVLTGEIRRYKK